MTADKVKTIEALLQSAIRIFAEAGYSGASVRDIARMADVPHSTINYYYGSKGALFLAALERAFDEIIEERSRLLDEILERHAAGPAPLEDLIFSLAYPVVRRALAGETLEVAGVALLSHNLRDAQLVRSMFEKADRSIKKWIDAIEQSCPTLSRADVIWIFSFCMGVCYSWQVTLHRYDNILGPSAIRTVDQVTGDIVAFCVAGVQAIVNKRLSE